MILSHVTLVHRYILVFILLFCGVEFALAFQERIETSKTGSEFGLYASSNGSGTASSAFSPAFTKAIAASRSKRSSLPTAVYSNSTKSSSSRLQSATFIETRSTDVLFSAAFSTAPNITGLARAEKCWSDIMTWRNQSAAWYNANVVNRTWSIGPTVTSSVYPWYSSTTIYPANVSTYKLCDGTPRANVRPLTRHFSGNSTAWYTFTNPLTPQYSRSLPCTPDPEVCRLWYYDSNIAAKDDNELLDHCGNPAHAGSPCLIGGGPVRLVYFPVPTGTQNLCLHNGSIVPLSSTKSAAPGLDVITTLGHTFTSGSAYLSFQTLFASYDGFWDRIGPQFSNYILPLPSSAVSTQCGGFQSAWGPGTPLIYGDLNWPVPASAYTCQDRCSVTITTGCLTCDFSTLARPPQCNTIWSDVNPILAVPTQVRNLAPEWSTCSFWDENIPNFWFDPPIALQQQPAMATPDVDPSKISTMAAPSSIAINPLPKNTGTTQGNSNDPARPTDGDPGNGPASPTSSTQAALRSVDPANNNPSASDAEGSQLGDPATDYSAESKQATPAAAVSVLAQALPSTFSVDDPSMESMVSSAHQIASSVLDAPESTQTQEFDPGQPAQVSAVTGAKVTIGGSPYTIVQSSGHVVLGSTTLSIGQVETISGVGLRAGSSEIAVGSSTVPFTALPADSSTLVGTAIPFSVVNDPSAGTEGDPKISAVAADGLTMTASALPSLGTNAVAIQGSTLSVGGPAVTISGHLVSLGSSGLVLETSLPSVVFAQPTADPARSPSVLAAGRVTITIEAMSNSLVSLDGTTLSQNGSPVVIDGVTVSDGRSGLVLLSPQTTKQFTPVTGSPEPTSGQVSSTSIARTSTSRSFWPQPSATSSSPADRLVVFSGWWLCSLLVSLAACSTKWPT